MQLAGFAAKRPQLGDGDAAREHIPRAVGQVVGLIHQQGQLAQAVKDARQAHLRVEGIVVIADDHVGNLTQGQGKLKGAQLVLVRHLPDKRAAPDLGRKRLHQGIGLAQIMSLGAGAVIRMAAHLFHRAQAFLGVEGERVQAQPLGDHAVNFLLHGDTLGAPGGEAKNLFGQPLAQRFERGVEHRRAFAGAGGHDGKQPALARNGSVGLLRHLPLAGAVGGVGEGQGA